MSGFETAAAAIAIAETTGKVLKAGYKLVSDAVYYGADAGKLGIQFQQCSHRYDSLQRVLFEVKKFPFLHGKRLFDVLPNHSQTLVVQLLLQLLRLLYSHFTLEQKYQAYSDALGSVSGFTRPLGLSADEEKIVFRGTTSGQEVEIHSKASFFSATSWSWAIRGKRRVVRINADFENWLKRTKAVLEDTWWPLPAFNVLANLETLQSDTDARDAGVTKSAVLRKLVIDKSDLPTDIRTPWIPNDLKERKDTVSGKTLGTFEQQEVLVETLKFSLDKDNDLPEILKERFSKIIRLLNSQKDPDFRVLHCLRYSIDIGESSGQLRLISQIPSSTIAAPQTLRTLGSLYRGIKPDQRPSLGFRFRICHQITESLFLLHSVDWVHRALRPDNIILIFPSDTLDRDSMQNADLRICGFEASRPAADASLGPYDNELSRNVYRHAQRWGTPRETFTQIHDVYSLGVIMLEIGLWERAEDMISGLKAEQLVPKMVTERFLRHVDERLAHRCGDVFAGLVRRCLTLAFDRVDKAADATSVTDLERQLVVHRGLLEHVLDPLKELMDIV